MRQDPPIVEIAWRAGEPLAVALFDDEVRAYHRDGRRAWSYRTSWQLGAFVVARRSGHSIAVSEDQRKLCLVDPRGVESFRMEDEDTGCLDLAISPDAKHVGLLSNAGQITWIKTDTEDVWNFTVDDACSIEVCSEAGLLGVGLHNGYGLFGAGGKPIWERDLPKISVVRSAISTRGDFMVLMASPGCLLMVLDRDGGIRLDDYRRFLPKDLALSEAGCFAAAYGNDDADLAVPFSKPVRLDLYVPRETGHLDFRIAASAMVRCFDLTPDGTLVTMDEEGIVEAWTATEPGDRPAGEAIWSFHTERDALALSALGKDGPALAVLWDDDAGEMRFDYRRVSEFRHGPA
jgi:hypothetical protein